MRFTRLILATTVMLLVTLACLAQEAAFVDLTQVTDKPLRRPAARNLKSQSQRGGSLQTYACGLDAFESGRVLRPTLVWLDRGEYELGDTAKFEVRVENIGPGPITLPVSTHVAEVQAADPAKHSRTAKCRS